MYPSFIFIRHGQSLHNERTKQAVSKYSPLSNMDGSKINFKDTAEYRQIKFDPYLIGEGITKQGENEALQAKKCINLDHIDLVVVSPLRRALETCDIIFGECKNVKIFVEPLLTQLLGSSVDIGSKLNQLRERYKHKFNFDRIPQTNQEQWYLNWVLSEQNRKEVLQIAESRKIDVSLATLQLMKTRPVQTNLEMEARAKKLKQQLVQYKIQSKKKIAIIGHAGVIKFITATGFFQDGYPINGITLNNGEVKQIPIIIQGFKFQDEDLVPFCKIR